jgi:hypothetical protein
MAPEPHPGRGWLTKNDCAAVFDVSARNFERGYMRYAPPTAVKTFGRATYVHVRSLLNAWAAAQKPAAAPQGEGDPLLAGAAPDSPGLERYREARADLAEMERDRVKASLIPREDLEPALAEFAGVLRRAGETLARDYGNDAATVLNEAVDETVERWEQLLGSGVAADV